MTEDKSGLSAWFRLVAAFVGPAAVMTAGIMGAGSTSALVLAGAWFRYDLLWLTLLILPALIICLDSGARIGIMAGGKGMLSVIRDEIHPAITWFVIVVMVLFNLFVNMGQMSVMTESLLSIFNWYKPGADATAEATGAYHLATISASILLATGILYLLLSGGYARAQKAMTGLLFLMFGCFLIVAVRGLEEFGAILGGLVPTIPTDLQIPGTERTRDSFGSIMAIAGGALAAAPLLSFSYFHADDNAKPEDLPRYFWKSVLNLGVLFGLYSVMVLVAGGYALYPLENHASIQTVGEAGRVLTRALPAALSTLSPKIFGLGLFLCGFTTLIVVAQLMCYFCLDTLKLDWHYTKENTRFRGLLIFWIAVPSVLSPFWEFPALLKIILLMGVNIVIVPIAIVIIIYLVNKRSVMGAYKANAGRNAFLAASLLLSLWLASAKLPDYWTQIQKAISGG
ncbi:MAG: divalent metal cation transporter [Candidatus Hydrogenedentes bacterium]|nr:divalent metal cation transporter [Candidatus Hydrogenedentota bacterium]